jgi:hypothetical protein
LMRQVHFSFIPLEVQLIRQVHFSYM